MTAAWEVIDSQTLSSAAASVTFSSIPQGYRDLVLVIDGTSSAVVNVDVQQNGDTGSNYSYVLASGDGSSPNSSTSTTTAARMGRMTTTQSNCIFQFLDYSATDKHKTMLGRANADQTRMSAGRYASTSATTAIEILAVPSPRTFDAGSTFTLYGSNRA